MVDLPDLSDVSPDRWLSRLDELRSEIQNRLERSLDQSDDPDGLADRLDELIGEVRQQLGDSESTKVLEIERRESGVAVRAPSETEWLILVQRGDGWQFAGDEHDESGEDESPGHTGVASHLLEQVPLWSEGAFASKVGEPERFIPDDE